MGTLSGTILGSDGAAMTAPAPRVALIPTVEAVNSGGEVRIGPVEVDLDAAGAFSITVPDGDYLLQVRFYDPAVRDNTMRAVTSHSFAVSGITDLSTALGLALLAGPAVTVVGIDTDGQPYYDLGGGQTYSVFLDTDGSPYYATGTGGQDVYSDSDGAPVVLTLT